MRIYRVNWLTKDNSSVPVFNIFRIFIHLCLLFSISVSIVFFITGCDKWYTYKISGSVIAETKDGAKVNVEYHFDHRTGGVKLFQSKEDFIKTDRVQDEIHGIKFSVEKGIERKTVALTFGEIKNDFGKSLNQSITQDLKKHYKNPSVRISLK